MGACCGNSSQAKEPTKYKVVKADKAKLANIKKKAMALKQLNMNDTKIKDLKTNGDLYVPGLTNINADSWGLQNVDDEFFGQPLKTISMNYNSISKFPAVFDCQKLTSIKLNHNKIKYIPEELSSAKNLNNLEISHNLIEDFSLWLVNIESVDISYNMISEVPEGEYKGTKLLCLNLSYNKEIKDIPDDLLENSNIHKLLLTGTAMKKRDLDYRESLQAYSNRRKNRMDIAVWNNLDVDFDLCGLTD